MKKIFARTRFLKGSSNYSKAASVSKQSSPTKPIKTVGIRDNLWLAVRPKLVVEWYRMWHARPVVSWLRAAQFFVEKDFGRAARYYEYGLSVSGNHPARDCARMDLAYCQYRQGNLEEALKGLQALTREESPLRDSFLLLAKIEGILGHPWVALAALNQGLEVFPADTRLLVAYVHTCLTFHLSPRKLDEVREKVVSLKRKFSLEDTRQVFLETCLAHFELRRGCAESGERMLARVLATGKAPFEAVLLRGERLLELGRLLPAREQLTRAMRAAPRNPRPVQLLAESYLLSGEFFEPEYAEQLAMIACRLSQWQNLDCLEILLRAYEGRGEEHAADLLREKCKGLRAALGLEQSLVLAETLREQRVRANAKVGA